MIKAYVADKIYYFEEDNFITLIEKFCTSEFNLIGLASAIIPKDDKRVNKILHKDLEETYDLIFQMRGHKVNQTTMTFIECDIVLVPNELGFKHTGEEFKTTKAILNVKSPHTVYKVTIEEAHPSP